MEYEKTIPFSGDAREAMSCAANVLTANGFCVTDQREAAREFAGPGMRSSRQNPLLGASQIRIESGQGQLRLQAELGGVATMRRFLRWFPLGMALFFAIVFGPVMGLVFGKVFNVGFGVPFARGWQWLGIMPLVALPLAPWLILSPLISRMLQTRTLKALDVLLTNMAASGQRR